MAAVIAEAEAMWSRFRAYEDSFDAQVMIDWTRSHAELPIFATVVYLGCIFYLPAFIEKPFKLRKAFSLWNIGLAVFSFIGATRVVPLLLRALVDPANGDTPWARFRWAVCTNPSEWYLNGPAGLWTGIFIYSKFPELLDTMFLVLRKKKVILLHWFHHTTVLMYCWHAFHNKIGPGIFFASMNYCVHAIMYFYYFLASMGYRGLVAPFAPFITAIQILQMVGGIVVTYTAAVEHSAGGQDACYTDGANWKLGLGMYVAYFLLFSRLFYEKYLQKRRVANAAPTGCDVGDAAGFFHGKPDAKRKKN